MAMAAVDLSRSSPIFLALAASLRWWSSLNLGFLPTCSLRTSTASCSETFVSAIVPMASSFKGNSGKDFSERDMMTEAERSAASEVRHRHREIESRVNKFAQNLHVLEMAVEAVEEGLDPCPKRVCLFVMHRPCGKACYVAQRVFVLQ